MAVESDLKAMLPGMQAYTHTIAKLQHIYPHTYENDDAKYMYQQSITFIKLFDLLYYVPVNNYGHVETVS